MKKSIKGKLYNTETAMKIGEYEPNPYRCEFSWYRNDSNLLYTLYRKRTGEFFLHCLLQCGDEKIMPITYEKAREWSKEHLDGDNYIKVFEPEKDDSRQVISVSLSKTAIAKLRREAAEEDMTLSSYIESLII